MNQEIVDEFEAIANPKEEVAQEAAPTVEEMEYYLGGKANKLPVNAEFAFNEGGKITKAPLSTMVNHYRQRADLDKRFGELKKGREEWEAERGDIEQYKALKAKWEALESWSREKPEEFDAIWNGYHNKDKILLEQKAQDPNSRALVEEIASLKQKLNGFEEFKSQFEQRQEQELKQQALSEVDEEAATFQGEWPEIKLDEKGEDGLSLKHQIMKFGVSKGLPDFESAALKFLKPKLLEIASQRARSEAVKGVKLETKNGVIARGSKPLLNGKGSEVNPRKMSWGEAANAAKAEMEALLRG